ncbi:PREDICTED: protein DEHYDRATION-INDUCED 19 homolog 5-like isoform X2 [Camelina sativa]|uniref:Protein DEHYDRATION-INDUCED 19 homolog 5-like isoform X2 n=1 Tax=Camelina sativa TaxID=90675 RepID=A0ABM0TPP1_CAMSA|nr:PREDICTED: protein DEHYDRATION-INDUCED 19 homolog 5-like isoform X2 [Camelina sativa]
MEEALLGICGFDSSKKYRLEELAKFQSGSCIEFEDDEMAVEYPCPFSSDDYDLVELCHHIDEEHHQLDANNGRHLGSLTKTYLEQKQRLYKDETYSAFSPGTRKYLQSLMDEPLSTNHTSKSVPDPLLSFIYNPPSQNQSKLVLPNLSGEASLEEKSSIRDSSEKDGKLLSPLSDTELLEKAKKREFVKCLISSAIFDHIDNF